MLARQGFCLYQPRSNQEHQNHSIQPLKWGRGVYAGVGYSLMDVTRRKF